MSKQELSLADTDKGSVRIDRKLHDRMRRYADDHGHRVNFVYERAAQEFLQKHKSKGGDKAS